MSAGGRRPRREEHEEHENHERWLVTYADMVTLLMVLFIVMFAMSQVDQKKFNALKEGLAAGFGQSTSIHSGSNSILDQPGIGRYPVAASPLQFGAVPRQPPKPAPVLGQHTDEILSGILGLPGHEIARQNQAIDAIEPAQHARIHHQDAAPRERSSELRSEKISTELRRLRQPTEQRRHGALHAPRREKAHREAAERDPDRAIRILLDWSAR